MFEVGDVIGGRLRVERVIGVGGMGVVAAATHLELRQMVAVKMLKPEMSTDVEIVERFLREARAVAQLRTEHVCRVFDVARTADGAPYIVMELLQGSDVASMIRQKPLPVATAIDFVMQACVALAEAHSRGIVHRDVKPPNLFVMRRPDGGPLVKVLDFGIARAADELRLTHSMTMLGSPQYMSPEQLTTPRDVDARTDIWSLGVTIYQLVTRRLAFPSAQIGELAVMITNEPPRLDDAPPDLRAVIARCLEKAREARYPDVGALAAALVPFGGQTARAYAALVRSPAAPPVFATPISTAPTPSPPVGQHVETIASIASIASNTPPPPIPSIATNTPPPPIPSIAMEGAFVARESPVATDASPPPTTRPPRNRTLRFAALGFVIVAIGGGVGYFIVRGSADDGATTATTTPTSADAAPSIAIDAAVVVTAPPDAAVVVAAPLDAAVVVVARPDASRQSELEQQYEQDLRDLEARLWQPQIEPETRQRLYFSVVTMACALGKIEKAKTYFARVTDETVRTEILRACSQHRIEL